MLLFLAHSLVCLFVLFQYGDYDKEFHTPGFLARDLLLPQRVGTQCISFVSAVLFRFQEVVIVN